MKKLFLLCLAGLLCFYAKGQVGTQALHLTANNAVQVKNYPLLSMLMQDAAVAKLLTADTAFARFTALKIKSIKQAESQCATLSCLIGSLKFTDAEIATVSNRLAVIYDTSDALQGLVSKKLIPSGTYSLQVLAPPLLLIKAWQLEAAGINHCIDVYGAGRAPGYPQIDSISYNVKSPQYLPLLRYQIKSNLLPALSSKSLFFTPGMAVALSLLKFNGRAEAADFEPMKKGVNKQALKKVQALNWAQYQYSLILILGNGPERADEAINAAGKARCRIGAQQYFNGMAPFIMVSGGRVHPYKTKYSEAYEMKKFLMDSLHVPGSAIIMEPHARHTSTNLRNCARIIYQMQLPQNKPAIVCSEKWHIDYVENTLPQRCKVELGFVPFTIGNRISDGALEFLPVKTSLQVNAMEPLDP